MKNKYYVILPVLILVSILWSCSYKYRTATRAGKKFDKNEFTQAQFDSVINAIYKIQDYNFRPHSKIKLVGSYVCEEYGDYYKKSDYRTLKFTNNSKIFKSIRFYAPVNNITLAKTEGVTEKYTANIKNDEIIVEYLLSRDFDLYNIFQYAKISENGDTIHFYKIENLQTRNGKRGSKLDQVYIYNPTLTALPNVE